MIAPDESAERWFLVTVKYATKRGELRTWHGNVYATWDSVHEAASAAATKARRRSVHHVYGSDATAYDLGYVPSDARPRR